MALPLVAKEVLLDDRLVLPDDLVFHHGQGGALIEVERAQLPLGLLDMDLQGDFAFMMFSKPAHSSGGTRSGASAIGRCRQWLRRPCGCLRQSGPFAR